MKAKREIPAGMFTKSMRRKRIPEGVYQRINSRISIDHAKYIKLHKKGRTEGEFLRSMLDYYINNHK